jgi:hypothetical protein
MNEPATSQLEAAWKIWVAQFPQEARRWEGRQPLRAGEK